MSEEQDQRAMGDPPPPGNEAMYAQRDQGDPPPHDDGSSQGETSPGAGKEEGDPPPDAGEETDAPSILPVDGDPPPH